MKLLSVILDSRKTNNIFYNPSVTAKAVTPPFTQGRLSRVTLAHLICCTKNSL